MATFKVQNKLVVKIYFLTANIILQSLLSKEYCFFFKNRLSLTLFTDTQRKQKQKLLTGCWGGQQPSSHAPNHFDTVDKIKTKQKQKAVLNLCIYNIYTHIYIINFSIKSAGTSDCISF